MTIGEFVSGAEGIRTPDPLTASPKDPIPNRHGPSWLITGSKALPGRLLPSGPTPYQGVTSSSQCDSGQIVDTNTTAGPRCYWPHEKSVGELLLARRVMSPKSHNPLTWGNTRNALPRLGFSYSSFPVIARPIASFRAMDARWEMC